MANFSSSGWSTANSPFDFRVDLFVGPVRMLITDTCGCQYASRTVSSADHLYAICGRLVAEGAHQVVVDGFDSQGA
jgi:hypothetical protein